MTQQNFLRRAFLGSIVALVLCLSMLIGITFAWFTDSVSSDNNQIVAGNLDIELYHTDGEHAGPYGDFLISAVLCRLLTGDVSDAVSGSGFSFIGGKVSREKPTVLEDKQQIAIELEKEKTDFILSAVRA